MYFFVEMIYWLVFGGGFLTIINQTIAEYQTIMELMSRRSASENIAQIINLMILFILASLVSYSMMKMMTIDDDKKQLRKTNDNTC